MNDPHASSRLVRAAYPASHARLGLIMIHGRGGSADDMAMLAQRLDADDIALAMPEARGNSWWPTSFLAPMDQVGPYLNSSLAAIDRAVAALERDGLTCANIGLVGFSQGACLALEYAARSGTRLHSVFGLSGALVGTSDAGGPGLAALHGYSDKEFDYHSYLDRMPVHLHCHEDDPHIPLKRVEDTAARFERLSARVTIEIYPGAGHGVMPSAIDAMRDTYGR